MFGNTCLNGSVNPKWRHNLRVTWETPWNVVVSAQWRFIGGTEFDNNSPQPLLQNQEEGFFDPLLTHMVPAEVSNQAGGLNTFTTYDILGRRIFVALHATF